MTAIHNTNCPQSLFDVRCWTWSKKACFDTRKLGFNEIWNNTLETETLSLLILISKVFTPKPPNVCAWNKLYQADINFEQSGTCTSAYYNERQWLSFQLEHKPLPKNWMCAPA